MKQKVKQNRHLLSKPSEPLMVLAGVCILVSVPAIAFAGVFSLWFAAKVLYATGLILVLVNH